MRALERARQREERLLATEAELGKIVAATRRTQRRLKGQERVGVRLGRIIAGHIETGIREERFSYRRNEQSMAQAAALDGLHILRTSVSVGNLTAERTVTAYQSLSREERAPGRVCSLVMRNGACASASRRGSRYTALNPA